MTVITSQTRPGSHPSDTSAARKRGGLTMLACAAAAALVSACADGKPAETPVEERVEPYNEIDPVIDPVAAGAGAAAVEGAWTSTTVEGRPAISFAASSGPVLSIACDGRDGLVLRHYIAAPVAGIRMIGIGFGGIEKQLAANPIQGERPSIRTSIQYNDALLPRMAGEPAPLIVSTTASDALMLPPTPLLAPLVRACNEPDDAGAEKRQ